MTIKEIENAPDFHKELSANGMGSRKGPCVTGRVEKESRRRMC